MQSSVRFSVRASAALLVLGSLVISSQATPPPPSAGLKVAPGYRVRTVFETAPFSVAGGLAGGLDGIVFGVGTNIYQAPNSSMNSVIHIGSTPPNTDIAAIGLLEPSVYVAYGLSFSPPFPHAYGSFNIGSDSIADEEFQLDGIFDIAHDDLSGWLFMVANPGGTGSRLYVYRGGDSPIEVANFGGYSGGISFDGTGGLYYADQTSGAVLRYVETNEVVGPLTPEFDPNPQVVASNVWGTYLAFDSKERLLATTGYGNELRAYDRWSGTFLEKIAWDGGNGYGIGQVVQNWFTRETILLFTDWSAYRSKVVALRPFWTGNDTDGNHIANVVAFDSKTAAWKLLGPESNTLATATWGKRNEQPIVGDFDGDGIGDLATRNVATGEWKIRYSGPVIMSTIYPPPTTKLPAGSQNVPCAADFFNDGTTDPAVYNKRTGQFTIGGGYVIMEATGPAIAPYPPVGIPGGIPVPGDYDGDGYAEPVVYIPGSGMWLVSLGDAISMLGQCGWSGATPVPSDYDGDGKTDIAVFNNGTAIWNIIRSSDGAPQQIQFGFAGCVPAPADYDGDQKADIAVYDPKSGKFWAFRSSGGLYQINLGANLQIVKP